MTLSIRPATASDIPALIPRLLAEAEARGRAFPGLWRRAPDATERTETALRAVIAGEGPIRQRWIVADRGAVIVGAVHTLMVPVPPIYAAPFGPPGLIKEDSVTAPNAPAGTRKALLHAAEADLIEAGAQVLLASSPDAGAWESTYAAAGYEPLTCYFAKTGLSASADPAIRPAQQADIPGITVASARHRALIHDLHKVFWQPHPEADARFAAWMTRSLALTDRDMRVAGPSEALRGYAVSQPASPLHFPPAHNIDGVGVIDDFFHEALADPLHLSAEADEARALFTAAEAARAGRGAEAMLVVCPARWPSKRALLESLGYRNALTWHIRIAG